jgi:hypothetical protein
MAKVVLAVDCRLMFFSLGQLKQFAAKEESSGKSIYLEVLLNASYEAIGCLGLTGHAWEYSYLVFCCSCTVPTFIMQLSVTLAFTCSSGQS